MHSRYQYPCILRAYTEVARKVRPYDRMEIHLDAHATGHTSVSCQTDIHTRATGQEKGGTSTRMHTRMNQPTE
ncbi:MAG: hypothetical protein CBD87_000655 [Rhizobiales bacterium TMED227]|nr:MAG: hypothetical protein CBD87_000655 [Rhizobiales bacterium TMED227]